MFYENCPRCNGKLVYKQNSVITTCSKCKRRFHMEALDEAYQLGKYKEAVQIDQSIYNL